MTKVIGDISELVDQITAVIGTIFENLLGDDDIVSLNDNSFQAFLNLTLDRLANFKKTMQRDYLKCVFVGRTSNGKSSVINALLKSPIFPMGIGHTTNCFITLSIQDIPESYIEHYRGSDLQSPIAVHPLLMLKKMTNAMSPDKVDANDTIKVNYPANLTSLYTDANVHFVDSPGLDIDNVYDDWIDKHCLDADVFVLVTNAESVLMQCERHFFVKVKERFCSPNILIVNNRWDSSAESDVLDLNRVKVQQMNMFSQFLVTEMKICSESQLRERVFFVSALEELRISVDPASLFGIRGRLEREQEFKRFESTLKENLSAKALRNKITPAFKNLEQTYEELNSFINCLFNTIIIEKELLKKTINIRNQMAKNMESDIARIHQKAANFIEHIVTKSRDKISHDFQNLVCNLDVTIDTVKLTFDPYNRKDYLVYQKLVVDNFENSLFQDLKNKTMSEVNGQLKLGLEKLTKIYTELVLSKPNNTDVSQCLAIACQSPIPLLHPTFSTIMNTKINKLRSNITAIPTNVLSTEECALYLNNVDNRFNAYSKTQVDNVMATGATAAHSVSKFPEVTLMIPKFSAVIMADYSFTPGFRFSLSPTSFGLMSTQWGMSHCPLRNKLRAITWSCVTFVFCCGFVTYVVISYKGRFWRHGTCVILGIYGGIYIFEKLSWDATREMMSLKNQFVIHCKQRMETIIHISAVTTARQLGSFLHIDLRGLQAGAEKIIREFHQQVDDIGVIESKILVNEKKFKKVKSNFYIISQQIATFKKDVTWNL